MRKAGREEKQGWQPRDHPAWRAAMAGCDAARMLHRIRLRRWMQLRREVGAVHFALQQAQRCPEREQLRQLWEILYIRKSHSLAGAALQIGLSDRTAQRYHARLLLWIAWEMGFLEGM